MSRATPPRGRVVSGGAPLLFGAIAAQQPVGGLLVVVVVRRPMKFQRNRVRVVERVWHVDVPVALTRHPRRGMIGEASLVL